MYILLLYIITTPFNARVYICIIVQRECAGKMNLVFQQMYLKTAICIGFGKFLQVVRNTCRSKVQPDTRIIVRSLDAIHHATFSLPNFDTDNFLGAPPYNIIYYYCWARFVYIILCASYILSRL